jgi:hypothetical protein
MNLGRVLFLIVVVVIVLSLATGRGGLFNRLLNNAKDGVVGMAVYLGYGVLGLGLGVGMGWLCFLVLFNLFTFADLIDYDRYTDKRQPVLLPTLVLLSFVAGYGAVVLLKPSGARETKTRIRGRELLTHAQARKRLRQLEGNPDGVQRSRGQRFWKFLFGSPDEPVPATVKVDPTFRLKWGFLDLPLCESTGHFLVTGSIGSGKSVHLRMLMQSTLPMVGLGFDCRALVYDPKDEFIPLLKGLGGSAPIHILNPFDQRSVAWNMAADINTPAAAYQAAEALVPDEKGGQAFWAEAPRHLLSAVMETFIRHSPGQWTLRDLILTMRWPARLEALLKLYPETEHVWSRYAGDERTLANLFSTLSSKLRPYEIVAALWEKAGDKVSLNDWAKGESILVLGDSAQFKTSLDPINQLMLDRVADLLLDGSETKTRKSWLFLDEARELGKVRKLHTLANKGRSKGISLVLGLQDIAGFRSVYGDKDANEITGQIANKTFLRTDSATTGQWAEEHFGKVEYLVRSTNSSQGGDGKDHDTTQVTNRVEPLVLASEVMGIPRTSPEHGFFGLHDVPSVGAYGSWFPFQSVIDQLTDAAPDEPNHVPRAASDQFLHEWTSSDLVRLKLSAGFLTPQQRIAPPQPAPIPVATQDQLALPESNTPGLLDAVVREPR